MKTVKCADVGGGTCPFVTTPTNDPADAKQQLGAHAQEAHADMMANATEESMKEWNDNFDKNVWPKADETE